MIWANYLFSFNMFFLWRKVEDVTTISKSQFLTLVSIKDCTLRVPNETTTLFVLQVIIRAIFIQNSVRDAIQRGAAENEVQKYEERLPGAWRQMSTLRRRNEKWCKGEDIEDCTHKQRYAALYQSIF